MTPEEHLAQERKAIAETIAALERFLLRIHYGSFVVKKCDKALLIEETRQEKKNLA
jgi:hypothetical protein